jgi:hypothetical protein
MAAALAARAAGVGGWWGYLGVRPRAQLGLAVLWERWQFDVARLVGGADPVGFCSGWDDPVALRQLAAAWRVRPGLDVEDGIRPDGPWVQGWLDAAGAGLYGLASVHRGRRAAFHVVARYPGAAAAPATWDPLAGPRPPTPCGWQSQGTHTEFGRSVDSGWYDDWFCAPTASASGGGGMLVSESSDREPLWEARIRAADRCVMLAWWSGGMGQRDSYTDSLTDLGRPPGDAPPWTASVGLTTHVAGHLRVNVACTTDDGVEWGLVYGGEPGNVNAIVQPWVRAGVPSNCPAVYVPAGQPGPPGKDVRPAVADALGAAADQLRKAT